jgi:membrane protein DedA with SNARE-associated domain
MTTLPRMASTSIFRPRRLGLLLAVAIAGLGVWWGLQYWNSESHVFEQEVKTVLSEYGPILLFILLMASGVGVAIGEDIFIIPAGYLMGADPPLMPFWGTIIAAYFGVIMADTLWLLVCRTLSKRILNIRWFRRFMHPRRILEIKYQFEQYGIWVIVISRFIPASRTTVITAAGIAKMSVWKFMLAETMSAIPTVICQLGIGYLAAMAIGTGPESQHVRNVLWISMLVLIVIAALWWWRRSSRAKRRRARAPMAWLLQATGRRAAATEE